MLSIITSFDEVKRRDKKKNEKKKGKICNASKKEKCKERSYINVRKRRRLVRKGKKELEKNYEKRIKKKLTE